MKKILLLSLSCILAFATSFTPNNKCQECHPLIYQEFTQSMHAKATIFKDPIHAAVWKKHPLHKKGAYKCAKCHTPAADNFKELIAPNGIGPDPKNASQNDAVACAYCHRIEAIQEGNRTNSNVISPHPRIYFGARKEHIASPFHKIDTSKAAFLKGASCMGCHSHNRNKKGLYLCKMEYNATSDCASCHMPQVPGSVSTLKKRATHAYHGFAGAHVAPKMLAKYVDLSLAPTPNGLRLTLTSHIPHEFLSHPARVAFVMVKVLRDGKTVWQKRELLVRILGHAGKPTPPWLATQVLKDTMLKANEKRSFTYNVQLQKGDKVVALLGYRLVKPPLAKKLGIDPKTNKPVILKKVTFIFEG